MSEIVEVGETQDGQHIELSLHQTLRVALPEVRTAGFRWTLRASSQNVLSQLADDVNAASAAVGGATQRHWDFRAERTGATELVFEYDRPWARAATAARTFTVSVHVSEGAADEAH